MHTHTKKPFGQRLLSAITLIAMVLGMASFASPQVVSAAPIKSPETPEAYLRIEGDPIDVEVENDGQMGVWFDGTAEYFGTYAKGSMLFIDGAGYDFGTGPAKSCTTPNQFTPVSHTQVDPWTIETVYDAGTSARVTQRTEYVNGRGYYKITWRVLNTSGSTLTNLKVLHGGDTTFQGDDSGRTNWDPALGMVYIYNQGVSGVMGLYGDSATPVDHYFGGAYGCSGGNWAHMVSGSLPDTVDQNFLDAGYSVEWDHASLDAGAEWVVVGYERFTTAGLVQVYPPVGQTGNPNQTLNYTFVIQNLQATADTFDLEAVSSNGWGVSFPSGSTITLDPSESGNAQINLTAGPTCPITDTLTVTATSQTDPGITNSGEVYTIIECAAGPAAPVITSPVTGTVTMDNTPTFTGTAEAGSTVVTVTLQAGGTVCVATVQPDNSWSCTPSTPLSDGEQTFVAIAGDGSGNESGPSDPVMITIDTVAPTAPTVTAPISGTVTNDDTPTFEGTGEPGGTVNVYDDEGSVVCTTTVNPDGSWSCTPSSPLDEGEMTYEVTVTDPAGNESDPIPVTITVDTTAPAAPVITAPISGTVITDPTPTFSGTAEVGTTVVTVTTEPDGTVVCVATVNPDGTWECTATTPLSNGEYTFVATGADEAGNESAPSDPVTVTIAAEADIDVSVTELTSTQPPDTVTTQTFEICNNGTLPLTYTISAGTLVGPLMAQYKLFSIAAPSVPAQPATVTINETFMNDTAPGWLIQGNAILTSGSVDPSGDGWLRLTSNAGNQAGSAIFDTAFSSNDGISVTFQYATYGGSGADGITFYLIDGATDPPTVGAPGGSLGYSYNHESPYGPGVTNGYVGIGFDEYGNFSNVNYGDCNPSCPGQQPNRVVIRGSGSLHTGFNFLINTPAAIQTGSRNGAHTVNIEIVDQKITVRMDSGSGFVTLIDQYDLLTAPGQQSPTPYTFKMGFSASTGGSTNYHEIRNLTVNSIKESSTTVLDAAPNPAKRDQTITFTATVSGVGGTPTGEVTFLEGNTVLGTGILVGGVATFDTSTLPAGMHVITARYEGDANFGISLDDVTVDILDILPLSVEPESGTVAPGACDIITVTFDSTGLTDGVYTSELVIDSNDPDSPTTIPVTLTVITGAPLTVIAPISGTVTSDTPTFAGTGEPGYEVNVYDDEGSVVCSATVDPDGFWTCVPDAPLEDGEQTFEVTQTDPWGGESAPVEVIIIVDTTPVVITPPIILSPEDGDLTNDNTPIFEGVADAGTMLTVTLEDGTFVCSATVDPDGLWECTAATPLPDGEHTFVAVSGDGAGNESDPSEPVTITIDTVAPAPPTVTAPISGTVTSDTPTFAGTGEPGFDITVYDDEGGVVCTATVDPDGFWTCVPDAPLEDGEQTFEVTQTDPAGNESDPVEVTITVDTTPVVITPPIIFSPKDGDVTNDNTPTFEGVADAGTMVTVTLQDGTFVCAATVSAEGTWECTPATPLPDGEQTFVAVSGDGIGNESDPSEPVTITIDTVAPAPPVIITPSEGATTGPLPTFSGTAEPGSTVRVEEVVGTMVYVICEAVTDAGGNWTCTATTPLSAGEHTAKATAVDEAGNESAPDEVTFTVAPVEAQDDTYEVPEGIGSTLDVLENDSSASGGDLTIITVGTPAHGIATTDGDTVVYTPTTGYLGADSFTYTIDDGTSEDSALVTVTVLPVADLAVAQTVRGTIGGLEFTLVVRNLGPRPAGGAVISDTFPPSLGNISWTCVAAGGAVCPNTNGTSHIEETLVTFPSGGVVTYTVATEILVSTLENNTVTITPPVGTLDLDMSNNSATRPTLYRIILPRVFRNADFGNTGQ